MTDLSSRARHLVCIFVLPKPMVRSADLAACLRQTLSMHAGANVIIKATSDRRGLRVFTREVDRISDIRVAIDTNRADWQGAGISEIHNAA